MALDKDPFKRLVQLTLKPGQSLRHEPTPSQAGQPTQQPTVQGFAPDELGKFVYMDMTNGKPTTDPRSVLGPYASADRYSERFVQLYYDPGRNSISYRPTPVPVRAGMDMAQIDPELMAKAQAWSERDQELQRMYHFSVRSEAANAQASATRQSETVTQQSEVAGMNAQLSSLLATRRQVNQAIMSYDIREPWRLTPLYEQQRQLTEQIRELKDKMKAMPLAIQFQDQQVLARNLEFQHPAIRSVGWQILNTLQRGSMWWKSIVGQQEAGGHRLLPWLNDIAQLTGQIVGGALIAPTIESQSAFWSGKTFNLSRDMRREIVDSWKSGEFNFAQIPEYVFSMHLAHGALVFDSLDDNLENVGHAYDQAVLATHDLGASMVRGENPIFLMGPERTQELIDQLAGQSERTPIEDLRLKSLRFERERQLKDEEYKKASETIFQNSFEALDAADAGELGMTSEQYNTVYQREYEHLRAGIDAYMARSDITHPWHAYSFSLIVDGAERREMMREAVVSFMLTAHRLPEPWEFEQITSRFADPATEAVGELVFDPLNLIPGFVFTEALDIGKAIFSLGKSGARFGLLEVVPRVLDAAVLGRAGIHNGWFLVKAKAIGEWITKLTIVSAASHVKFQMIEPIRMIGMRVSSVDELMGAIKTAGSDVAELGPVFKVGLSPRQLTNLRKVFRSLGYAEEAFPDAATAVQNYIKVAQLQAINRRVFQIGENVRLLRQVALDNAVSTFDVTEDMIRRSANAWADNVVNLADDVGKVIENVYLGRHRLWRGSKLLDEGAVAWLAKRAGIPEGASYDLIKGGLGFNKSPLDGSLRIWGGLMTLWKSAVLTLRPGFTIINFMDSLLRATLRGANPFMTMDEIMDAIRFGLMPEEILARFAGGELGEAGENIAQLIMKGDVSSFSFHEIFKRGWDAGLPRNVLDKFHRGMQGINSAFEFGLSARLYAADFGKKWLVVQRMMVGEVNRLKAGMDIVSGDILEQAWRQAGGGAPGQMSKLLQQIVDGRGYFTVPDELVDELADIVGMGDAQRFWGRVSDRINKVLRDNPQLTEAEGLRPLLDEIVQAEKNRLIQERDRILAELGLNKGMGNAAIGEAPGLGSMTVDDLVTPPAHGAPTVGVIPDFVKTSKPRYGYGKKLFEIDFDSPLDKAIYVATSKNPSARRGDFIKWIKQNVPGLTDDQIKTYGKAIREQIKSQAKLADQAAGPIRVSTIFSYSAQQVPPTGIGAAAGAPPQSITAQAVQQVEQEVGKIVDEFALKDDAIVANKIKEMLKGEGVVYEPINRRGAAAGQYLNPARAKVNRRMVELEDEVKILSVQNVELAKIGGSDAEAVALRLNDLQLKLSYGRELDNLLQQLYSGAFREWMLEHFPGPRNKFYEAAPKIIRNLWDQYDTMRAVIFERSAETFNELLSALDATIPPPALPTRAEIMKRWTIELEFDDIGDIRGFQFANGSVQTNPAAMVDLQRSLGWHRDLNMTFQEFMESPFVRPDMMPQPKPFKPIGDVTDPKMQAWWDSLLEQDEGITGNLGKVYKGVVDETGQPVLRSPGALKAHIESQVAGAKGMDPAVAIDAGKQLSYRDDATAQRYLISRNTDPALGRYKVEVYGRAPGLEAPGVPQVGAVDMKVSELFVDNLSEVISPSMVLETDLAEAGLEELYKLRLRYFTDEYAAVLHAIDPANAPMQPHLPLPEQLPMGMRNWLRASNDVDGRVAIANNLLDRLGQSLNASLDNRSWQLLVGEEQRAGLAVGADALARLQQEAIEKVNYGGSFLGQQMEGAVDYVNDAMIDYATTTNPQRLLQKFFPFLKFPQKSLPFWLETMFLNPEIPAFYAKYIEASRRHAYELGAVNSAGEQLPRFTGYLPIPGTDKWWNPLAPFSFRFVFPRPATRYDESDEEQPLLVQVLDWMYEYGTGFGFNLHPWVNGVAEITGMLDKDRHPRWSLIPQPGLVPPFATRWIAQQLRKAGMSNARDLWTPEAPWKQSLIEVKMLELGLARMSEPGLTEGQRLEIAKELEQAMMSRDLVDKDGKFEYEKGAQLWLDAQAAVENGEYANRVLGYFTSIYPKEFTADEADLFALRDQINVLKYTLNNEAGAVLFKMDPNVGGRWKHYLEQRYNTPEGWIADLYGARRYTIVDGVQLRGEERNEYIAQNIDESQRTRARYEAINQKRREFLAALDRFDIGAPWEERQATYQKYFEELALIEVTPEYSSARREWVIGWKPKRLVWEDMRNLFWATIEKTAPVYRPDGDMSYGDFLKVKEAWQNDIGQMSILAAKAFWDTFNAINWIHPEINGLPNLLEMLQVEASPDGYRKWQLDRDTALDALARAWTEKYWQEHWNRAGGKEGMDFEIAQREFYGWIAQLNGENKPIHGQAIGPSLDVLFQWVQEMYPGRFTEGQLVEALGDKEVLSADERMQRKRQVEIGPDLAGLEEQIWKLYAMIPPGNSDEFLDEYVRLGGPYGEEILAIWRATGNADAFNDPEQLKEAAEVWAQAVRNLGFTTPSNDEMLERKNASELNEQFREVISDVLGSSFFEEQAYYFRLSSAERRTYRDENPDFEDALDAYKQLRDAYGIQFPDWAKFYHPGVLEEGGTSGGGGAGGGGGGSARGRAGGGTPRVSIPPSLRAGLRGAFTGEALLKKGLGTGGVTDRPVWPRWLLEKLGEAAIKELNKNAADNVPLNEWSKRLSTYLKNLDAREPATGILAKTQEVYQQIRRSGGGGGGPVLKV